MTRAGALALALAVVVGTGLSGCATYSDGSMATHEETGHGHSAGGHDHGAGGGHGHDDGHVTRSVGDGRSAALSGYRLESLRLRPQGDGEVLTFQIRNPSGAPHLQYELDHGKLLHLYVVAEDESSYHHVHPLLDANGAWTAELPRLPGGRQHVVASFVALDEERGALPLVLGDDVTVEGPTVSRPLPPPRPAVRVDGYVVRLTGTPRAGRESRLRLAVTTEAGRPARLQPYLEAWVHATAVHEATGALVHLHPEEPVGSAAPPRRVTLSLEPAQPGRYRLFLEFTTASGVHQAALTRIVR